MPRIKRVGGLVVSTLMLAGCTVSFENEFRGAVDRIEFDTIPLAKGEKTSDDYTPEQISDLERFVRMSRAALDEVPNQ